MLMNLLKDIRKIYAGLDADAIRATAYQPVKVGLMAGSESGYRILEDYLAPTGIDPEIGIQALRSLARVDATPTDRFDFVICEPGITVPANGYAADHERPQRLMEQIARDHKPLETALSRIFPPFRKPVAHGLISRIARENAVFSIVTALPNMVPNLVELPWAVSEFATDTAFLTMNQIRMALTLAAASDRPVGYAEQKVELAAIVGGAFGWRALARQLVGKIPLGGGLIPKAAIAFAGTYVVGMGLEKLHRTGSGLSSAEKKAAYADAFERGKTVAKEIAPGFMKKKS